MVSRMPKKDPTALSSTVGKSRWRGIGWIAGLMVVLMFSCAALAWSLIGMSRPSPPEIYGAVPDFEAINDEGTTVTRAALIGNPCVVDFIFTRCGGQCPM